MSAPAPIGNDEPPRWVERRSAWLGVLLCVCVAIDAVTCALDRTPWWSESPGVIVWLIVLAIPLAFIYARVPNGYLSLSGIVTSVAAIAVNPRASLLVSLVPGVLSNLAISRSGLLPRSVLVTGAGAWTVAAAWTALGMRLFGAPAPVVDLAALSVFVVCNWLVTASVGAALLGTSPITVLRRNANRRWIGAFFYICVSAAVLRELLDGSTRGYVLATLVVLLSLALADAVAGRQLNRTLLSHLSDVERHLSYSRVVEGTIHNIRNFLAVAVATVEEAQDTADPSTRERQLRVTERALYDALAGLDVLGSGSSPRVTWSSSPIDLAELTSDVAGLVADRAARKRVRIEVHTTALPQIYCDPGLIRQIVTNLCLNSIDAVAQGGHVSIAVGWRMGNAFVSVADDGPGVPDKYRARLFEPHFTTKPDGSGIGLFVSYGIAREHGGDLLYEGDSHGAVFTLLLKQDGREH